MNVYFFPTELDANGFPKLPADWIHVDMREQTTLTGKIVNGARTLHPNGIPSWMDPEPLVFPLYTVNVYIRTTAREDPHFFSFTPLKTKNYHYIFKNEILIPKIAWLRLGEDMNYIANNFAVYNASQPQQDISLYGHIYITSTDGHIYTTILQVHPEEVLLNKNQEVNKLRRRGKWCQAQRSEIQKTQLSQGKEKST